MLPVRLRLLKFVKAEYVLVLSFLLSFLVRMVRVMR